MSLQFHPIANIFPLMPDDELAALADDIEKNGQREAIWLWDGYIIDGRNRYKACEMRGVIPTTRIWDGDEKELVSFVVSLNLHRRHLTASQRGMIADDLRTMKAGHRSDLEPRANLHEVSKDEAATLLNVSPRTVAASRAVKEHAAPAVVEAVRSGAITLNAASQIAALPAEVQEEIAAQPAPDMTKALRGWQEILKPAPETNGNGKHEPDAPYIKTSKEELRESVTFKWGEAFKSFRVMCTGALSADNADKTFTRWPIARRRQILSELDVILDQFTTWKHKLEESIANEQ